MDTLTQIINGVVFVVGGLRSAHLKIVIVQYLAEILSFEFHSVYTIDSQKKSNPFTY